MSDAPADALAALADEYWEAALRFSPTTATALGDRRYDDRLADVSPQGVAAEVEAMRDLRQRLDGIDAGALGAEDRVTHGELAGTLDRTLALLEAGLDEWIVSPLSGPQTRYLNLTEMQALRDDPGMAAWAGRVEAMATQLGQVTENLLRALGEGRVANRMAIERVLGQLDRLLATPDADWGLVRHLESAADGVSPEALDRARARVVAAVAEGVRPGFEAYRTALRDQVLPAARGDDRAGLMHVPGGDAAYQALIRYHTSLDMTAQQIHDVGLAEVDAIRAEMTALGKRHLETEDFASLTERLRSDTSLFFTSCEEIEEAARAAIERAEEALGDRFGLRHQAACEVRPIPAHEAPNSTIAYYMPPAADGSRPGVYFVNTYAPETRPRYEAEVLAFHEAVPGHHLQIAIAQERDDLPTFRRHGGVTSYIEGWALYTERLADEMGLYADDLSRLGALSFEAWRACRLVVDTGLHALGWTRQRAIDFMAENTALARNNIENEVDRYVVMPGQALSYKLGQLEIFKLRREAQEAMGEAFDLAGFHDRVLENGAVCLEVLGQQVRGWAGIEA